LWMYDGQAPFGQFFREREKQIGIQFIVEVGTFAGSLISRKKK
jgi:hypothetical protein